MHRQFAALATILIAASLGVAHAQRPAQPKQRRENVYKCPEVHPDRRVTFRIYAPKAAEVTVYGAGYRGATTKR